jgi:hypothetical protein
MRSHHTIGRQAALLGGAALALTLLPMLGACKKA